MKAVIFVIDSSSKERLSEAQGELVKLISEDLLKDACLLILANKQVDIFVILKLYAYGLYPSTHYLTKYHILLNIRMLLGVQRSKRSQRVFHYISYAVEDPGISKHVMLQVGQGYRMDWIGCPDSLLPQVHHMSFLMLKPFRK